MQDFVLGIIHTRNTRTLSLFLSVYMSLRFREIKTGHVDLTNISVIEERTWSSLGEVSNGHLAWLRDLQRLLAFLLSILEHPCYCVGIAVADGSTKNTITSVNKLSLSQVYLCRLIHTQVRDVF